MRITEAPSKNPDAFPVVFYWCGGQLPADSLALSMATNAHGTSSPEYFRL